MKISYGNSRLDKKWKNSDISRDDFVPVVLIHDETNGKYRKLKGRILSGCGSCSRPPSSRRKRFCPLPPMVVRTLDYGTGVTG